MKAEERAINVTSTLTGEKIGMTIDESALSHIMSVLTDLYSDPEMAVIREYSTNAFDSHVEAGVKRPIEVTLPSPLSPFFRVRDFGVGMTIEDIRSIYSRYGTSTKRQSNDVVGMLGLGCKSALTYTDQFTLTGIRDGIQTQVSVSRDADGAGSMTIVATMETDDPDGVEIIVPTKVGNRFEQKANDFFRFWEKGRVLVNGKSVDRIDGMWIAPDLLLTKDCDKSYVVMGNVAYPMPDYTIQGNYFRAVSFVDIGAVSFTPSREALQMTTRTKETLEQLKVRIQKERNVAMQKQIDEAPNKLEAVLKYKECRGLGYAETATWRGYVMPISFAYPENLQTRVSVNTWLCLDRQGWRAKKGYRYSTLSLMEEVGSIWVTDFPSDTMSPHKRQKLDIFLNGKGLNEVRRINFTSDSKIMNSDWLDPKKIFAWADIDAIKVPKEIREKRSDGRPTGSYKGIVAGTSSNTILAKNIDVTKPIFWVHSYGGSAESLLRNKYKDATFITLPANRVEKFKRDFPEAKEMNRAARDIAETWSKSLSADDVLALNIRNGRMHAFLHSLDEAKFVDPSLQRLVRVSKNKNGTKLVDEYKVLRHFEATYKTLQINEIEQKYPLLLSISSFGVKSESTTAKHIYLYANAVFAAETEV